MGKEVRARGNGFAFFCQGCLWFEVEDDVSSLEGYEVEGDKPW